MYRENRFGKESSPKVIDSCSSSKCASKSIIARSRRSFDPVVV